MKKAISDGPALIAQAVAAAEAHHANPAAAAASAAAVPAGGLATKVDASASTGTQIRQWLMTGVSYMIPFVAAGGILIALGFMLAQVALGKNRAVDITAYDINLPKDLPHSIMHSFNPVSLTWWAALLFRVGATAFGFVPALSGFIAYAIADRPGLVPGFVGGALANATGAGFLGGLVTGILSGLVARWISGWKVGRGVRGVMPVVVIPLLSTLIVGGLFVVILGRPIKGISDRLTSWLNGLSGGSAIVLGLIVGAMMGFDLGGPVNKVAYFFGTTGLAAAGTAWTPPAQVMAAVMAAGMVAPLGMALATTLRLACSPSRSGRGGKAAWLLGLSFISEGRDPVRRGRPAARHLVLGGRLGHHRCPGHVPRPDPARPARRHLGRTAHGQRLRLPHRARRRRRGHGRARRRPQVERRLQGRGCGLTAATAYSLSARTPRRRADMATRKVTIASSVGLHARPAALFVQAASATGVDVEIGREGRSSSTRRASSGSWRSAPRTARRSSLSADGDGADEALDSLVELLSPRPRRGVGHVGCPRGIGVSQARQSDRSSGPTAGPAAGARAGRRGPRRRARAHHGGLRVGCRHARGAGGPGRRHGPADPHRHRPHRPRQGPA